MEGNYIFTHSWIIDRCRAEGVPSPVLNVWEYYTGRLQGCTSKFPKMNN